mgnify:CR=1 FL=1
MLTSHNYQDAKGQDQQSITSSVVIDLTKESELAAEIDDIEKVVVANFSDVFSDDFDLQVVSSQSTQETTTIVSSTVSTKVNGLQRSKSQSVITSYFSTASTTAKKTSSTKPSVRRNTLHKRPHNTYINIA